MSMSEYSLSDLAAATSTGGGIFGGGSSGAGVLIILFLIIAMMGGGFGGFGNRSDCATKEDVVYTSAFNQLQSENSNIINEIQKTAYNTVTSLKDGQYNNLSEIRDVQAGVSAGFANLQNCCCETLRAIDGVNYNGAINTASINANTTAQIQKVLDVISGNRIADLQSQVNQLQLQSAMCGVVRYPTASAYYAPNPFCSCGGSNF